MISHGRNAGGSKRGVDHPPLASEERLAPSASPTADVVCVICGGPLYNAYPGAPNLIWFHACPEDWQEWPHKASPNKQD